MDSVEYKEGRTLKDIDYNQRQLIDLLNHRMSLIEDSVTGMKVDVKWIKGIGYYMAGIITAIATKLIFL